MVFLLFLAQKSPALQETRSTQQECRPGVWWLHQCEVVSIRYCCKHMQLFRECGASGSATAARTSGQCAKESCKTPFLNKQTRVELPKCEPGRRRPQKQSTAYDTVLGTTGEAFRRGPELHRKDLTISLYQVVARARRSSDAAVLQV